MKRDDMNLDVAAPDKVAKVLRQAAQAYSESASELEAAWQDRSAGKPWNDLSRILEKAAAQAEVARKKWGH